MAKRLLLTLLALLGLAAQVAPAHAGACGRAASELVLAAQEDGGAIALVRAPARRAVPTVARLASAAVPVAAAAPGRVPVLIGIDRARE